MKKLFTVLTLIAVTAISAQAPQGFNYQATVRNSSGALIINQYVNFKFNIMLNSQTNFPVFTETHQLLTDDLGQVSLVIGSGTATVGSFSSINWGIGNYYLGIELNTGGGYVAMGIKQLLSVPYALYANSSGSTQVNTPDLSSVLAVNNGANNMQIKNLANPTGAQDAATKAYIDTQLQTQISALQTQITALQNFNVTPLQNVTIGTQIWQSTNLDVLTYRDGTPIPQVTDPTVWENLTTGAWCYYNNDSANGITYGKLYNWYAVAGIHDTDPNTPDKILAPIGWHIPTDAEWTTLITFLGGESEAGGKMKSIGTALWQSPNTAASNSSGFTGLPGGCRFNVGIFYYIGNVGNWWSLSQDGPTTSWYCKLNYNNGGTYPSFNFKKSGFSVRCLRD